jgi:hypothetical protein
VSVPTCGWLSPALRPSTGIRYPKLRRFSSFITAIFPCPPMAVFAWDFEKDGRQLKVRVEG